MKVIKRNGTEVVFDISKILVAVGKANNNVKEEHRMTPMQIQRIAESVELNCIEARTVRPRWKRFRTWSSTRSWRTARLRWPRTISPTAIPALWCAAANTTDDKILSLIECSNEEAKQENSNKNPVVNSTQRDYMAGEVCRDITNRLLLPKDIVEAHKEGIIHFHDSDYYAQHMHNCDLVNLEDMLQNGTVITGTLDRAARTASPPPATSPPRSSRRWPPTSTADSPFRWRTWRPLCRSAARRSASSVARGDARTSTRSATDGAVQRSSWRSGCARRSQRGVQTIQYQVRHAADHQRSGAVCDGVHVPERGEERAGKEGPCADHRGDAEAALSGRQERSGRVDHPGVPQADLCAGGGQHPRGVALLLSDRAGGQVHRQAHGAGLYLRKEDAGAEGDKNGEGTAIPAWAAAAS